MKDIETTEIYNNIIDDLSLYVLKRLKQVQEEFGVKEFSNKAYDKEVESIVETVYKELSQLKFEYKYDLFSDNNLIHSNLCQITTTIKSVKWIKTLNIYLGHSNQFDSFILMNTMAYKMNNMMKLVPVNYKFYITDSNEEITDFYDVYKDEHIKCITNATIVIIMPEKIYSVKRLKSIIKHELGHLSESLDNNQSIVQQNSDTLELLFLGWGPTTSQQTEYFIDSTIDYETKKSTLLHKTLFNQYMYLTYDLISDGVAYLLYFLNKSEMRQRLNNFEYDILQDQDKGTKLHIQTNQRIEQYLISHSDTYRTYLGICQYFELLVKYTPVAIKKQFATNDIKNVYDKTRDNDDSIKKPYGNKIKFTDINNEYNEVSFDIFFNMYINNIQKIFLHNALSMSQNALFESPYKFLLI